MNLLDATQKGIIRELKPLLEEAILSRSENIFGAFKAAIRHKNISILKLFLFGDTKVKSDRYVPAACISKVKGNPVYEIDIKDILDSISYSTPAHFELLRSCGFIVNDMTGFLIQCRGNIELVMHILETGIIKPEITFPNGSFDSQDDLFLYTLKLFGITGHFKRNSAYSKSRSLLDNGYNSVGGFDGLMDLIHGGNNIDFKRMLKSTPLTQEEINKIHIQCVCSENVALVEHLFENNLPPSRTLNDQWLMRGGAKVTNQLTAIYNHYGFIFSKPFYPINEIGWRVANDPVLDIHAMLTCGILENSDNLIIPLIKDKNKNLISLFSSMVRAGYVPSENVKNLLLASDDQVVVKFVNLHFEQTGIEVTDKTRSATTNIVNQQSAEVLKALISENPNTVIDQNWEEYLNGDEAREVLQALLEISKTKTYQELLINYEGYTVEELLLGVS